MKSCIYILIFCCFLRTEATALNLDSLWNIWNDESQHDTNRLQAIDDIAHYGYLFSNPDSAYYFAQLEYNLAEEKGQKKYMAAALNCQGISLDIKGHFVKALSYYRNSLKLRKKLGDLEGVAGALSNIGAVYGKQGDYSQAVEHYSRSLKIIEGLGDNEAMARTLNNLGVIYQNQNHYTQATEYFFQCLKIQEEINDKWGMVATLSNIGLIYYDQSEYPLAMEYFSRCIKLQEEINDKQGMAATLHNIGLVFQAQQSHDMALEYYNRSLIIDEVNGNRKGIAATLSNIGAIYYLQDKSPEALKLCLNALKLAENIGDVILIRDISGTLYRLHSSGNDFRKALEMYKQHVKMRDSIINEENTKVLIKQQYKYIYEKKAIADSIKNAEDTKVKDAQLAVERAENNSQKLQANFLYFGLAVTLLFGGFVFNRLKVVRRQKKLIEEQKQEVEYQKGLVDEKNKDITDSIRYAERIQNALLPSDEELTHLPDSFVLYKPKDIVSGDFYWMQHHNDRLYFAICDCTGHGVPGAFMSMICSSLLDEAVVEKGFTKPSEIFSEVRKGIINALKQTGKEAEQKDGMDATLFSWNKNGTLQLAAAYNPVLLFRNGELQEIKADRQPVGVLFGEQKPFTHHELKLNKGDVLYLFSDGYADQFGGPKGKKFKFSRFKDLLLSIQDKSMNEQKEILEQTLAEWQGEEGRVDDILVMGVKF